MSKIQFTTLAATTKNLIWSERKKYQGLSFDLISINVDYIFVGALLHI